MTPEEKQLLLKDLCARLPYDVQCEVGGLKYGPYTFGGGPHDIEDLMEGRVFKPYLRPMSSMTEEEKEEYKSFFRIGEYACGGNLYGEEYEYIDADSDDISQPASLIDWLLEHHFDFRGLIEKSLAIEAPENMYEKK